MQPYYVSENNWCAKLASNVFLNVVKWANFENLSIAIVTESMCLGVLGNSRMKSMVKSSQMLYGIRSGEYNLVLLLVPLLD